MKAIFYNEWEKLILLDIFEYRKLFIMFMCQKENSHDCAHCPFGGLEMSSFPCGQQSCWVDIYCTTLAPDDEIADVGDYDDMPLEEDWDLLDDNGELV